MCLLYLLVCFSLSETIFFCYGFEDMFYARELIYVCNSMIFIFHGVFQILCIPLWCFISSHFLLCALFPVFQIQVVYYLQLDPFYLWGFCPSSFPLHLHFSLSSLHHFCILLNLVLKSWIAFISFLFFLWWLFSLASLRFLLLVSLLWLICCPVFPQAPWIIWSHLWMSF